MPLCRCCCGGDNGDYKGTKDYKNNIQEDVNAKSEITNQQLDQDNLCYRNRQSVNKQTKDNRQPVMIMWHQALMTRALPYQTSLSSIGPQGQQGPAGPKGEPGTAGPTRTAVVTERAGTATTITPGTFGFPEASCNSGEITTGSGSALHLQVQE